MSFLGPVFLVSKIRVIALILSAIILVIFSDFFNQGVVFPLADSLRSKSHGKIKKISSNKWVNILAKYLSEGVAAIIFIGYCYLGSFVLAEYIFIPIFNRLKNVFLIVVIVLYLLVSYVINNKSLRNTLMKF